MRTKTKEDSLQLHLPPDLSQQILEAEQHNSQERIKLLIQRSRRSFYTTMGVIVLLGLSGIAILFIGFYLTVPTYRFATPGISALTISGAIAVVTVTTMVVLIVVYTKTMREERIVTEIEEENCRKFTHEFSQPRQDLRSSTDSQRMP